MKSERTITTMLLIGCLTTTSASAEDLASAKHGFAESGDIRIPYVTMGEGPLDVMIHGLKDKALLAGALNNTWEWLEQDLTLVTLPDAGHFVQQDAADTVTRTIVSWLCLKSSN